MVTQKLKLGQVQSAIANLEALAEKPRDELSLREAIEVMREAIKQVMARGYGFDDVAKSLEKDGIIISGATLKSYIASSAKKSLAAKKGRGTARQKKSEASNSPGADSSNETKESDLLQIDDTEAIKSHAEDGFSNY